MDAVVLCGAVHAAAAMTLFGSLAVRPWLATPLATASAVGNVEHSLIAMAAWLALLSAVVWLLLESAAMADDVAAMGDPDTILAVLNGTAFGRVWRMRLVIAAVAAGLTVRRRAGGGRLLLAMAALQVASLGWTGHAAMEEGLAGFFQRANQSVHLLAGAAWIGALPSILILLAAAPKNAAVDEVDAALRRFSGYGAAAVVLLLISGAVNVWMRSGGRFLSLYGPYGQILLVKLVLVAGMIGLALANRALVAPVLSQRVPRRRIWLRINVLVETILGLMVLAVAFILGNSPPP